MSYTCPKCGSNRGYKLAQPKRRRRKESPSDPLVMRRLLINLYNTAYHAGHEDTVEGSYTDVLPVDMDSYHDDVVDEWLEDYLDNEFSARNEAQRIPTEEEHRFIEAALKRNVKIVDESSSDPGGSIHKHWRVEVSAHGDLIVAIEPKMLAGRDLSDDDIETIRHCAMHLLGFIGN